MKDFVLKALIIFLLCLTTLLVVLGVVNKNKEKQESESWVLIDSGDVFDTFYSKDIDTLGDYKVFRLSVFEYYSVTLSTVYIFPFWEKENYFLVNVSHVYPLSFLEFSNDYFYFDNDYDLYFELWGVKNVL